MPDQDPSEKVSPYLRRRETADSEASRSILRRMARAVIGRCAVAALTCYATYLSLFRQRHWADTKAIAELLPLMKHFHSADAYGSNPFAMFVNAYLHTLAAKFLRSISYAKPSVELGAGDGSLSEFIFSGQRLTLVSSVVPSDIPHLVKRSIPEKIAIIDAEQIPLPDDSANFVFMVNTLYHIGDQRRAIAEISRILRPDGLLAFNYIMPTYLLYASPGQRCLKTLGLERWRRRHFERLKQAHFIDSVHTPEEIRVLIRESGFEIVSWHLMASRTAIKKAYTLYQLVKTAHAVEPELLHKVTQSHRRRNTVDTLLKNVFLPLVANDREDCQRVGHLAYWVLARVLGSSPAEPVAFRFVCPICRSAFGDSSSYYNCTVCGRVFPVVDGAPVFLTSASRGV